MLKNAVPVTMGTARFSSREVNGLLVTEAHFPAGLQLPLHTHERATVAIMLEGSFDCVLPGKTLPCGPGALHTEPAEERHGNRMGSRGAHVLVIQPTLEASRVLGARPRLLEEVNYAPQTVATGLAWRLAREVHAVDSAAPLVLEGLVLELMGEALRATASERTSVARSPWLDQAQEYVHANFRRSFTVGDVARAVGVPPVRLARTFHRRFGVTLGAYARSLRLDWAAVQLATPGLSLSLIATHAGFADQSHFTRMFRDHTGLTPRRYREVSTAKR